MIEQIKLRDLFFKPTKSGFKAISDDQNVVISENYKMISREKKFLGLKRMEFSESKEIFLLEHEHAHNLARLLFKTMTNAEPQPARFYNSIEMEWAAFLFTADDNMRVTFNLNLNKDTLAPRKGSLPPDIDFVIGVNSGYNIDDKPNFYLILKHKTHNKDAYLTIENYKFTDDEIEMFISEESDIRIFEQVIQEKVSKQFLFELAKFIELYEKLASLTIEVKYFVPVCLDLHDLNRSITSIRNDSNLKKRVADLIKSSVEFIGSSSDRIPCSRFVDFIIRYNYFNIEAVKYVRKRVEELFVQKRAYQKVENIFPGFFGSESTFIDYSLEQEDLFHKIKDELIGYF